jgi:zinc transport system substrate-binding protein
MKYLLILLSIILFSFTVNSCSEILETYQEYGHDGDSHDGEGHDGDSHDGDNRDGEGHDDDEK